MLLLWQTETEQVEQNYEFEKTQETYLLCKRWRKYDFEYLGNGDEKRIFKTLLINLLIEVLSNSFCNSITGRKTNSTVPMLYGLYPKTAAPLYNPCRCNSQYQITCRCKCSFAIPALLWSKGIIMCWNTMIIKWRKWFLMAWVFAFVKYINRHFLLPVFDFLQLCGQVWVLLSCCLHCSFVLSLRRSLYKSYLVGSKWKCLNLRWMLLKRKI